MKKENRFSPPAVGGSWLLTIFALLILCIFALLCLSTVQAERRLSDSAAQSVQRYYAAEAEAEQVFAQLRSGKMPPQVTRDGAYYRYICPISHHQILYVELRYADSAWEILRWQAMSTSQLPEEQSLPVWGQEGGTP